MEFTHFCLHTCTSSFDRLCGLLVRVPGYRSRGPGFDYRRYHVFWEVVGLERSPLSLVRITEELLEWKSCSGPRKSRLTAVGIRCAGHATFSICEMLKHTSAKSGDRSFGIVRLGLLQFKFPSLGCTSRIVHPALFPCSTSLSFRRLASF
jgi:hypothetical protein